jgi:hypothetical protein
MSAYSRQSRDAVVSHHTPKVVVLRRRKLSAFDLAKNPPIIDNSSLVADSMDDKVGRPRNFVQ